MAALPSISAETFEAEVVEASRERPVLVDFWGPRCGPCLKMMPWVERFAEEQGAGVAVVKVNAEENRRVSLRNRVMGLPTFILFRDGKEAARLSGDACTPAAVADLVQRYLAGAETRA